MKVRNVWLLVEKVRKIVIQLSNKHTELRSPVSDMIPSQNVITKEFKKSTNAVALNRASQMPDMHVFGDVWTAEVY